MERDPGLKGLSHQYQDLLTRCNRQMQWAQGGPSGTHGFVSLGTARERGQGWKRGGFVGAARLAQFTPVPSVLGARRRKAFCLQKLTPTPPLGGVGVPLGWVGETISEIPGLKQGRDQKVQTHIGRPGLSFPPSVSPLFQRDMSIFPVSCGLCNPPQKD